jgi:hypothetical protein
MEKAMDHRFVVDFESRTPEEQAVLWPCAYIMLGLHRCDHAMVHAQLLPGFTATLIRQDKLLQLDAAAFVGRLPLDATDVREEIIHEPSVKIDTDIAMLWTPYKFFINGKLHHVGTNILCLAFHDGRWLVSHLADNSRLVTPTE